jgi:hypothetical protein
VGLQKAPRAFASSELGSLTRNERGQRGGGGHRRRGKAPVARLRGGKVPQGVCAPLAALNWKGAEGSGSVAKTSGRQQRGPVGDRVPVVGDGEEVVKKLPGGVEMLGVGSIGSGEGRGGASHGEPGAVVAALGGSGAPVRVGRRPGVGEHERGSGQLPRGFTRAGGGGG